MCKSITYQCACGHYTTTAIVIPCHEARRSAAAVVAAKESNSSAGGSGGSGNTPAEYQLTRRNAADAVRRQRHDEQGGRGVEACTQPRSDRKRGDPYWEGRWCDACAKRACDARKRLLERFREDWVTLSQEEWRASGVLEKMGGGWLGRECEQEKTKKRRIWGN